MKPIRVVQATAPTVIYLCVDDEKCGSGEPFPEDYEGVTWSVDEPVRTTVPYIRMDKYEWIMKEVTLLAIEANQRGIDLAKLEAEVIAVRHRLNV